MRRPARFVLPLAAAALLAACSRTTMYVLPPGYQLGDLPPAAGQVRPAAPGPAQPAWPSGLLEWLQSKLKSPNRMGFKSKNPAEAPGDLPP
jgi:hypothetical protein